MHILLNAIIKSSIVSYRLFCASTSVPTRVFFVGAFMYIYTVEEILVCIWKSIGVCSFVYFSRRIFTLDYLFLEHIQMYAKFIILSEIKFVLLSVMIEYKKIRIKPPR